MAGLTMHTGGLLLSDDLIFTSRIVGTAETLGLTMQSFRAAAPLLSALETVRPACLILDLHTPLLDLALLLAKVRAAGPTFVVGYGSHVAAELLHAARDAGCDLVLPRSKFVEVLPQDMPKWFGTSRNT